MLPNGILSGVICARISFPLFSSSRLIRTLGSKNIRNNDAMKLDSCTPTITGKSLPAEGMITKSDKDVKLAFPRVVSFDLDDP